MSWQSKYAAQFTKPLKYSLFAIIYRDMAAALASVNASANYPNIVTFHRAAKTLEQFPALLLTTERQQNARERELTRPYAANFYLSIAVAHQDPETCADMLEDYVLAIDRVLYSAWELTTSDFYSVLPLPPMGGLAAGSSAPGLPIAGSLDSLEVEDVAYDEVRRLARGGFGRAAVMSVVAEMEEN
jgi:hypothetical protein